MTTPYRDQADRPEPPPTEPARELGAVRSAHRPTSLARALAIPALGGAVPLVVGLSMLGQYGPSAFLPVLPTSAFIFCALGINPFLMRNVSVDVHENGIAVRRGAREEVVFFDDVDEVRYALDVTRSDFGAIVRVKEIDLVLYDRRTVRVPTSFTDGGVIAEVIVRRCSSKLLPEARRALRDGETLTFGNVRLDRDGLQVGSWAARWSELSLVRFHHERISLFRGQTIIPARRIHLSGVPHPTVLATLIREHANKVDIEGAPPPS